MEVELTVDKLADGGRDVGVLVVLVGFVRQPGDQSLDVEHVCLAEGYASGGVGGGWGVGGEGVLGGGAGPGERWGGEGGSGGSRVELQRGVDEGRAECWLRKT